MYVTQNILDLVKERMEAGRAVAILSDVDEKSKSTEGAANAEQNQDAAKFRTQGCQERSPLHVSPTGGLKQCVTQKSDPLLKCPRQEREEPDGE